MTEEIKYIAKVELLPERQFTDFDYRIKNQNPNDRKMCASITTHLEASGNPLVFLENHSMEGPETPFPEWVLGYINHVAETRLYRNLPAEIILEAEERCDSGLVEKMKDGLGATGEVKRFSVDQYGFRYQKPLDTEQEAQR